MELKTAKLLRQCFKILFSFVLFCFLNMHIALLLNVHFSLLVNACSTICYYFDVAVAQCGTRQVANF